MIASILGAAARANDAANKGIHHRGRDMGERIARGAALVFVAVAVVACSQQGQAEYEQCVDLVTKTAVLEGGTPEEVARDAAPNEKFCLMVKEACSRADLKFACDEAKKSLGEISQQLAKGESGTTGEVR